MKRSFIYRLPDIFLLVCPRVLSLVLLFSFFSFPAMAEEEEPTWPYQKFESPTVPQNGSDHPIDAFVRAELAKHHLDIAKPASRFHFLQRLSYDVTGLRPSFDELEDFAEDTSIHAIEKQIDRLLNHPGYGERWAQHWLDIVRYSDTEGYKWDRDRSEAFRYRDYVIQAFNQDKPYDRFLQEQIAGDELFPDDPQALIATGFFRVLPEEANASDYRQVRQDILNDVTDVFGMTFLGLTMGCARCHDHKFDPITQEDYFHLQAFFAPILHHDDLELLSADELRVYQQRMQAWERLARPIQREMEDMIEPIKKKMFEEIIVAFDPETQTALKTPPQKQTPVQKQLASLGNKQLEKRYGRLSRKLPPQQRQRYDELQKRLLDLESLCPPSKPVAMGVRDVGPVPPKTFRLSGGNYLRPKEAVEPDYPECIDESDPKIQSPKEQPQSTGRRSALAKWMVQPGHPLTARVMVNRIWQHYFGKGIVATPNDFGRMGGNPSHSDLLDFLACELERNQWSLKAIHRLILTSKVYQQSSELADHPNWQIAKQKDPENKLLWHARIKRRDGETLRDNILQLSDSLNPRMFGSPAKPELPPELDDSRYSWYADESIPERNRRSIYVYHRRNMLYPIFQAFDQPDRVNSCPVRANTTTAPQALVLLNGEFALEHARRLAGKILQTQSDPQAIARVLYLEVFGRHPSATEVGQVKAFLRNQTKLIQQTEKPSAATLPLPWTNSKSAAEGAAIVDLCLSMINSSEFLFVE